MEQSDFTQKQLLQLFLDKVVNMEFLLKDKNIKYMEIMIFIMVGILLCFMGFHNIDSTHNLISGLYFMWFMVFAYSIFGCFFGYLPFKKKKSFIFLIMLSFLIVMFIMPKNFDELSKISIVLVLYNIIFFLFLNYVSEINNKFLTLLGIIILLLGNCLVIGKENFEISSIITYILSILVILHAFIKYKGDIFKKKNLHNVFFILGCFSEILVYFVFNALYLFSDYNISPNLFLFFNILQPILYWMGINISIIEK